jgi:hypothetical protein
MLDFREYHQMTDSIVAPNEDIKEVWQNIESCYTRPEEFYTTSWKILA